jgi:hypothetical protein
MFGPVHGAILAHGVILALIAATMLRGGTAPSLELTAAPSAGTWTTYTNARYGFVVRYPAAWGPAQEADNGDGIRLQGADLPAQVLVYAGYDLGDATPPAQSAPGQTESLVIASGQTATVTVNTQADTRREDLALMVGRREYHVVVSGPEPFLRANEDIVRELMSSLQVNN